LVNFGSPCGTQPEYPTSFTAGIYDPQNGARCNFAWQQSSGPNVRFGLADIARCLNNVRFTPQRRTLIERVGMSALCQKRTHAPQQISSCCAVPRRRGSRGCPYWPGAAPGSGRWPLLSAEIGMAYKCTACALRPPRSIELGASSRATRCAASSRQRLASISAPSASSFELRTISTLCSMSSWDQPRE